MTLRPVLRSGELPGLEPAAPDRPMRIRDVALAATWSTPLMRQVDVGRSQVLLARLPGGQVVAFGTNCPHQGTPMRHATFYDGNVRCPQHNYVYDPRTGQNILPTRDTRPERLWRLKPGYLRTHQVEERDGWIWVSDEPNPPPAAYDPEIEARPPREPRDAPEAAPAAARPEGPVQHPAESATLSPGAELDLVLPTRPLPGHLWRVECDGDAVTVLGQTFHRGAQDCYRVRVAGRGAGEATVRCLYGKPWAATPLEVRTFHIRVGAGE